jgi:hypothetical protein
VALQLHGEPLPQLVSALAGAGAAALAAAGAVGFVIGGGAAGGGEARTVQARVLMNGAVAPTASASLRVRGGRGTLLVRDLPAPAPRRVYQLWVQRPAQPPVPAGATFVVRSGAIDIPHSLKGISRVLVTEEPIGGSRTPSRPPSIVAQPA